ncbi:MAG: kynureninase [Lactobacillus sp.]|uniref:Kynureninase n=1 Tax=Bombilactobacillus bombi TaxID=1303590 RepID=A0A347ST33_9LACO|nr:kynureninase [Bombilactobacillus bombi]AXX65192.1 kynureninase [Bombilactobacillus bombi]MCO6542208.1 kynureninase [Lactobacillus sp.]MCO6543934.1 kynureninase [Lactobacillus sp.]RHW49207.1 kynureninase [Bombilactobacillus bombi]
MKYQFTNDLKQAQELDQNDPLASIRDHFYIQPGQIYMDGNSLGLASKDAEQALLKMMDVWKTQGINMWDDYFHYGMQLGAKCAQLINAKDNEVLITGSTTSNVHSAVSTLYHPTKERYKILVDDLNFPTDRYAIDSEVRLKGYTPQEAVKVVKSPDGKYIDEDAVIEAMTDDVALILLPTVLYRSAQILDMERITKAAHERDIIIGWDLCHAIGAIPMDFEKVQPDFAIWCTYKYLSAGPGSIAGLYLNQKHFDKQPGLAGWWGNRDDTQFQLKHQFEHQQDVSGWQIGTPTMLAMAPLEGTLNLINSIGMDKIRTKSLKITAYLMYLIDEKLAQYGCTVGNPREDDKRGGHVCLEHPHGYQISLALKERNVIPDFREPDVIRLAPIALYTSYQEVYQMVEILEDILKNKTYEQYSEKRGLVV